MYNSNEFVRRTFYSLELKHQICKDHVENGLSLRECVDKYNLSCHSLVHDWLRKLGYVAGINRRTRSAYIGIENFQQLPNKSKKKPATSPRLQRGLSFQIIKQTEYLSLIKYCLRYALQNNKIAELVLVANDD